MRRENSLMKRRLTLTVRATKSETRITLLEQRVAALERRLAKTFDEMRRLRALDRSEMGDLEDDLTSRITEVEDTGALIGSLAQKVGLLPGELASLKEMINGQPEPDFIAQRLSARYEGRALHRRG